MDWNEIYSQYKQRISKGMNNEQLFEVLADMLNELPSGELSYSSSVMHEVNNTTDNNRLIKK